MKYPTLSLFLVAVFGGVGGCGEVSSKEEPDAGPELPDGPQTPTSVTVRVTGTAGNNTGAGLPDPNAIAIFVGPDGTVIQQGKVNDQGEAQAVVPAGSTVQTLQISETSATARVVYAMTFHDVKPGDTIASGIPRSLPDNGGTATAMTGVFTPNQSYNHVFYTECGSASSAGPSVVLSLNDNCHGATLDILGIQTSVAAPPQLRYAVTTPPHANGESVNLSSNWQGMANFVATISNLPEDISNLSMRRSTFMRAGAVAAIAPQTVALGNPPAGSAAGSIPYPPTAGVRAAINMTLSKEGLADHRLEAQTADVAAAITLDYNELSVPWVSPLTYTAAERKLSWTETASGPGAPDLRIAAASYRYTRDTITYNVFAYDYAKPSKPEVVIATLPATYAEFDPAQQASPTFQTAILAYVDQSNINGYDESKGLGLGIITNVGNSTLFADQAYHRRSTTTFVRPR